MIESAGKLAIGILGAVAVLSAGRKASIGFYLALVAICIGSLLLWWSL